MKLFKKSVSLFLALLMIFGSVSLLATAADSGYEYNWEIDTKFYRMKRNAEGFIVDADGNVVGDENDNLPVDENGKYTFTPAWEAEPTNSAAKGEPVVARVFLKSDFAMGASNFLFRYSKKFLTHNTANYTGSNGSFKPITNTDPASKVYANLFDGSITTGTESGGQFELMVDYGYLDESQLEDAGWINAQIHTGKNAFQFDGSEWFIEFHFTVNKTILNNSDGSLAEGQLHLWPEAVANYETNFDASTMISGQPDGVNGHFSIGTEPVTDFDKFAYTLHDEDEDSNLTTVQSTLTFNANGGTFADGTTANKTLKADIAPAKAATGVPANPTKNGYSFVGWVPSTVENPTEADVVDTIKIGYTDVTYNALYKSAAAKYVYNLYTMDVNGEYPDAPVQTYPGGTPDEKIEYVAKLPENPVDGVTYVVFGAEGFALDEDKPNVLTTTVEVDNDDDYSDDTDVITVYLERNEYTATFGETEVPALYGAEYKAPAGPGKEGYAFAGWKNGDDLLQEGDTRVMGIDGATYTATYTPAANVAKIIINYVDQTADPVAEATKVVEIATVTENTVTITEAAAEGEKVTNILFSDSRLALEHYKLNPEAANETSKVVAANGSTELNLYYIPETYKATFSGAESVEGTYYSWKNAPEGPARPGETFLGWSEDGKTVALTAGQEFRLEGNASYTPLYEATDYSVTYVFDGAAPEVDLSKYQKTDAKMNEAVVLPEMEAAGWTFLGWTVSNAVESEGEYKVGTKNVTVTGKWVKNTYVVNYWLDDAMTEIYFSEEYSFGDDVEVPENPADEILPTPGTTFVKWEQKVITVIDADTADTYFVEDPDVAGRYVYDNIADVTDIEYTVTVYYFGVPEYENDPETEEDESIAGVLEGYLYGDELFEEDLPDPSLIEGYDFIEWKIGNSVAEFPYIITDDVKVRGYFEVQMIDVTFYADKEGETGGKWLNGDTVRPTKVAYGSVVPNIELPVKEGYHLNEEMPWGVELGEVFEAEEYYAEWIANKYTVKFDVEGTVTESSQSYEENIFVPDTVVTDPAVVKPGYEFKGWTADGGATVVADITTVTVPLNGATYKAVYAPASGGVDYKIERYFMNTDGNYDGVEADVITRHEVAETPVSYNEAVLGFTLDTEAGKLSDTVAGNGSTVLTAYYIRDKYAVTYMALGKQVDTAQVYYKAAIAASDDYTAAPAGYNFLGWSRSADATAADADLGTMDSVNGVTLYAVLDPIEYPVNYVIAYEGNEVAYTSQSVAYTAAITAPAAPTAEVPEGYTFKGWAATKGATEALTDLGTMDTTVAEGKTFYAVLESSSTVQYTIEKYFMETDGKTYTKDESKTDVLKDGVAGVEKTITPGSYEGFTFDSDNENNNLTAMVKGDGTTVFKVYYDRNTVKVTINEKEEDRYYGEEIEEDEMPDHPPAPEGMEPDGWVDGNDEPVEFPVKVGTEDIVINPHYKASEIDITFKNGDQTVQSGKQTFGEILAVPEDVNVPGYEFDGWYADGVKVEAGVTTVPSKATTYTAVLTPIEYTVTFKADGQTVQTGEYAFGTKISTIVPAYAAPAGYNFGGWSTDGSTPVELANETVPVGGVTYIAILTPAEGTAYTVETYVMKTDGISYARSSETKYATTGTEITYVPTEKPGFTVEERSHLVDTVTGDGKMVIKVFYSRNTYTVTIDNETDTYYFGEVIEKEAPEADEGYTFAGWTDGNNQTVNFPYTVPANNVTIKSNFDPIPYDVIFMVAGQEYSNGKFDFGSAVVDPGEPSQDKIPGYTFIGWAKTENGEKVDLATETVPVGGVTYYAILESNDVNYTVKKVFQNTDGLTWGDPVDDVRTAKSGSTIALKAADENVNGFTVYKIEPAEVTVAGNGSTVIYIYYTRNTVSVTVNGEKDDYYYGEKIEEPKEPSKDGYTFGGWVDEGGKEVEFPITVDKDMVITPVFNPNTVSLSFEVDGKTVEGYPVDVKVDADIEAPTAPEKEGYNFVDWYIKGTNTAFNGKMPTADTVYEARYTAGANTKVTIEIYTMNTDGETYSKTVGYTFGVTGTTAWLEAENDLPGLTPNLEKSHLSDTVAADGSTVLSIYYDRDLYKVTWDVDGVKTTDDVYYGAEIVAPADPEKDGYVFTGWTPAVPATMPESNLEFSASWTEAEYTVTYVVNGTKTSETHKYNETVTVKDAPEVEGMTFNGWFDGETEYVAGATFKMPADDLIIVADFATGIFKVTYLNADGSVFATEMVRYDEEIPVPEDKPVKEHYEFTGWNIVYDKMPAMDITVEPIFERIAVKLIPMAGSTTQIDRENFVITGLREYLKEGALRSTFLDVEGDGFFTVTPSVSDYCGTGAKVELYDNLDPSTPIETYTIVIYGDINGDSLAQAIDSTYADDEGLMLTDWSEEQVYDPELGATVANPDYDPYKVMAADLNGDGIIDAIDAQIIGDASIGMLRINQVTGRPS